MKTSISLVAVVLLTAMLVGTAALGADTGQVSATVTASIVAVTVGDGSITYGTVATAADTTSNGVNDTQTITNAGTVNETFRIKGQNSTGQVWTLGGSAGDATYKHATCISTCDTTPSWAAMTASYAALSTGITPSGTTALDLQVTVPTSNSGTGVATLPVDIQAISS